MGAVAIAAAGLLGLAPTPPAEPVPGDLGPLEVQWVGGPSCPSATTVRSRVTTLLGGPTAEPRGEGIVVLARAEMSADGSWTALLEFQGDAGGRRTIRGGRDCAEAAEAAAVVIAIAIDPDAAARAVRSRPIGDEPEPAAEVVPEPEPEPEPPEEEDDEPAPGLRAPPEPEPIPQPARWRPSGLVERRSRGRIGPVRGVAGVVGGFGISVLPGVAVTVGVEGGITLPRARFTVGSLYWFRRRVRVQNATVDFRQWSVAGRGCPVFGLRRRSDLLVCGGVEFGQTLVRTAGVAEATDPNALWIAWLLAPGVIVRPLEWLGVRASLELFGPFTLTRYDVRPVGEVFTSTPVGLRGLVAIEALFP